LALRWLLTAPLPPISDCEPNDDLAQINGTREQLEGKLQERYG
jgi:hypothetical protein